MLLHYVGKLINQKLCIFHEHKTCFKYDFLSSLTRKKVQNVHHLHGHMPVDAIHFPTESAPDYHARVTIGLLQHETPDFIPPGLTCGHLTAPT